jgi:hypothetical protein
MTKMPLPNEIVAYTSIGLQFVAAARLAVRPHWAPIMLAFSISSLGSVYLAMSGYWAAWTVAAWIMILLKLGVAAEAATFLLDFQDDNREHFKTVIAFSAMVGLIAMALNSQTSVLYSCRFICHALCAGICGSALYAVRNAEQHIRRHAMYCTAYFVGMSMADASPVNFNPALYWSIHLPLAACQALCWLGWIFLFTGLSENPAKVFRAGRAARLAGIRLS